MAWWKQKPVQQKLAAAHFRTAFARVDQAEKNHGPNQLIDHVREFHRVRQELLPIFLRSDITDNDRKPIGGLTEDEFPAWAAFGEDLVFQSRYYQGLQSYLEFGREARRQLVTLFHIGHLLGDILEDNGLECILYLAPDPTGVETAQRVYSKMTNVLEARHVFCTYADADQRLLRRSIILCDLDWCDQQGVDSMAWEKASGLIKRLLKNDKARQVFLHQEGAETVVDVPLEVSYREIYPYLLDDDAIAIWKDMLPDRLSGWYRLRS